MSADSSAATPPQSPPRRCPLCNKVTSVRYRPFCSKRCADLDLGRWLNEVYRIPSQPADEEDNGHEDGSGAAAARPASTDDPDDEAR